jgi:cyclophilin family peptidyl-prolyl cis-trans isomerase
MISRLRVLGLLALAIAGARDARAQNTVVVDRDALARGRLFEIEDRRDSAGAATVIVALTASPDADLRRLAVRALGRFEQPAFAGAVIARLADGNAAVRAEAANALGQIAQGGGRGAGPDSASARLASTAMVARALRERLPVESDAFVTGVLARSLGRLPYDTPDRAREVWRVLANVAGRGVIAADPHERQRVMLGVLHGMNSLWRRTRDAGAAPVAGSLPVDAVRAALGLQLSAAPALPPDADVAAHDTAAFVRRLALSVLIGTGDVAAADVRAALLDPDVQVRRIAVTAIPLAIDPARRVAALVEYTSDRAPMVRLEAARTLARIAASEYCARAADLWTGEAIPVVALQAVDLAGTRCGAPATAAMVLPALRVLAVNPTNERDQQRWRPGAHARLALARLDPVGARSLVRAAVSAPVWQSRAWTARTAAIVEDTASLLKLARDSDDNVRTAATAGLRELLGHAADSVYVANLARDDHELIMASAGALVGTPHGERATSALLATLARLTSQRSENTRDARLAVLDALQKIDNTASAQAPITRLVADFDSSVARRAAEVTAEWTGAAPRLATTPLPIASPNPAAVSELQGARLRLVLSLASGIDSIDIELRPDQAPASVVRVVTLASRGWYNGLTWHRIVPNFVIQGGSPDANEYSGDAAFMRDELGLLSHTRGAVGISTRGRDTGDAQLFIDLVDNWRLDHDYTVIGYVVRGMEVLDRVAEGDRMLRVAVVEGAEEVNR